MSVEVAALRPEPRRVLLDYPPVRQVIAGPER